MVLILSLILGSSFVPEILELCDEFVINPDDLHPRHKNSFAS
jgi:hypothetical protein